MGKKDKKKGKGVQKTIEKTEKKAAQKLRKELKSKGEEDIEAIIAQFQEQDKKKLQVTEHTTGPPSLRSNFTLTPHPDKDELILFGGEFFNGSKTFIYNDLYFYNIKKNEWTLLEVPNSPPPRCAHQAVALSQGGGQLWIFGGEFASPTQSQFHHYKDLWVFHLQDKRWEKITASGGPSSRSGHRMVAAKKQLFVFGGFHDNVRDYKYFDDIYVFNLETYKWNKLEPSGVGPSSRSGCQMAALTDGRIMVFGGYSKERQKRDIDKGIIHTDMFLLQSEKSGSDDKWKWVTVRQSKMRPPPRCSFSMAITGPGRAVIFGGVHDQEEEDGEDLVGNFYNDMYSLQLDQGTWHSVTLSGHPANKDFKVVRRQKGKDKQISDDGNDAPSEDTDVCEELKNVTVADDENSVDEAMDTEPSERIVSDDGVFTVKIGPQTSTTSSSGQDHNTMDDAESLFWPHPRMNAGLAFKHGILYLYSGLYEDGSKQITLDDFYSLDLHKLDEWKTLIPLGVQKQEWEESSSSSEDEDEEKEETEGACGGCDDGKSDSESVNKMTASDKRRCVPRMCDLPAMRVVVRESCVLRRNHRAFLINSYGEIQNLETP